MAYSFLFKESWYEALTGLSDQEYIELTKAVLQYGIKGLLPESLSPSIQGYFFFIKREIDQDKQRWQEVTEKRSEAGRRGNASRWNKEEPVANHRKNRKCDNASQTIANCRNASQEVANIAEYEDEYDYENENIKEKTTTPDGVDSYKEATSSPLTQRKDFFLKEVEIFKSDYPPEILSDFCDYWTEPNPTRTRMRFELERTWSTARRLKAWAKNEQLFHHQRTNNGKQQPLSDEDILRLVAEGCGLTGNRGF